MGKRIIDFFLFLSAIIIFILSTFYKQGIEQILWLVASLLVATIFFLQLIKKPESNSRNISYPTKEFVKLPVGTITELVLLNEENQPITYWPMYGKTSLVIGLDIGENQVNVNLDNSTYASMIDVEHAVLNYTGGNWYVEDLGSQNGVSVIKSDQKKYKLAPGKLCLLEKGDIVCIALTKLKLS